MISGARRLRQVPRGALVGHRLPSCDLAGAVGQTDRARLESLIDERESVANANRPGAVELSEGLCFDLCAAGRAITRAYRPFLWSLGLTYPQYLVIVALGQRAPRTVTELGDRLGLDSGTLSPLLKRLDASGLVTRSRRTDDERTVDVALTSKGAARLRAAATVPAEMAAVLGLSARASDRLRTLLKELTASLARQRGVTPGPGPPRSPEAGEVP